MTAANAVTLPVHGGLDQPVDRIDSAAASAAEGLATVEVNDVDRTTLYRIADGTLSPLQGPMAKADYDAVLAEAAIERGGSKWAWTIPIILPVTDAEAAACVDGAKVALTSGGAVFGVLEVDGGAYDWDTAAFVQAVYRTDRTDHPGARLWTSDERTKLVGGTITLVPEILLALTDPQGIGHDCLTFNAIAAPNLAQMIRTRTEIAQCFTDVRSNIRS